MLGIAPADFEFMTLSEFEAAEQGFIRRQEIDYRSEMNMRRWSTFAIMSSMCDMKGRGPTDVLPLPWDETPKRDGTRTTRRNLKREREEALREVQKLEKWREKLQNS